MIDISVERLLTLREAAKLCPLRRNRKQPDVSCLFRWAKDGFQGVHLEVLKVGSTTCTSAEALQRFFEELTRAAGFQRKSPCPSPTDSLEAVNECLDELGV
jgi:hypothetical protein